MAAAPDLLKLDAAGFLVNMCMIATFFTVPIWLSKSMEMSDLWKVYVPLSVFGGTAMMFSSRKADAGSPRKVITMAFAALATAFFILSLAKTLWMILIGFAIFFTGFSVLEATLPAAVSKLADPMNKGAIIGVYNLSQFSGTFVGGMMAGWLNGKNGGTVFMVLCVASALAAMLINGAEGVTADAAAPGPKI